jgi:hypothetical protein
MKAARAESDRYYNVHLPDGTTIAFNVTVGHYSAHSAPRVALELQVAP